MQRTISWLLGTEGFWTDRRASAATEMALVLPGIAFILLNVVDLGVYIYTRMQVDLAAQEAVGAARVLCDTTAELPATTNCGGTLSSTMTSAAQNTTLGSNVTLGSPSEAYYCANSSGTLVQVAATNATPPANCSATLSGSTSKPGDYISVTASYNFTPVFPGASVASLMPATIQRTAWMRLQ
ncbi:MAG TPA: TadE/TadG family type IV pilus assembly protein [Novosphingobium sp.]